MARPFNELRTAMKREDIDGVYMARQLGISTASLSSRMMAKVEWTLEQMYTVLDILGEPRSRMAALFPRGGKNEREYPRRKGKGKTRAA